METGENSSTSVPFLPNEIIMEILHRLPVKSLVRFRCVCKFWQNLTTSDGSFIQSHLQQSLNKSSRRSVLAQSEHNCYSISHSCTETTHQELKKRLEGDSGESILNSDPPFFLGTNIDLSGSINGVFCVTTSCGHSGYDPHSNLYLWNPALHQLWTVPLPLSCYQSNQYKFFHVVVGFLFDALTDDYEVVKVFYGAQSVKCEMYSLRSNSWKLINLSDIHISVLHNYLGKWFGRMAIEHKGCLHWTGYDLNKSRMMLDMFDPRSGHFEEFFLPFGDCIQFAGTSEVWMFKGRLSIFGFLSDNDSEIWMMTEYGVNNSWTKQYRFSSMDFDTIPLTATTVITAHGKLLAVKEGHIILYDPETRQAEESLQIKVTKYDFRKRFFLADYVESLVSVIPTHSGERNWDRAKETHSDKKGELEHK